MSVERKDRGFELWDESWGERTGGRTGRLFAQGALRYFMLRLISEQPRHGYEIIKVIEESVGRVYSPSPGVIYPLLNLLEEQGFIAQAGNDGVKKLYAITPEGRSELDLKRDMIDAMFTRIAQVREQMSTGRAPQLVRAVENLRTALRLRTERGDLSEAQIDAVTDILDAAARKIDKI